MRRRDLVFAGVTAPVAHVVTGQPTEALARFDWPAIQLIEGRTLAPGTWRGQAAVVVFWATYCPYCKRHNAHVDKLYRATQGKALQVLGVALESNAEPVQRYMATLGYGFPVTLDNGDLRKRFTARRVIPMTCVLDREGRLLQSIPGEMSEDDVLGLERVLQVPKS